MNSMPDTSIKLPDTKYKLKKQMKPVLNYEFHVKCSKCKAYSQFDSTTKNMFCLNCNTQLKIKNKQTEYFVFIPLQQQIQLTLEEHWDTIINYKNKMDLNKAGDLHITEIRDVHDGEMYKKINSTLHEQFLLSLTLNTDGIQVFESNSNALWPI